MSRGKPCFRTKIMNLDWSTCIKQSVTTPLFKPNATTQTSSVRLPTLCTVGKKTLSASMSRKKVGDILAIDLAKLMNDDYILADCVLFKMDLIYDYN